MPVILVTRIAAPSSRILRCKGRFCIGLRQIVFGVRLILTRLLGIAAECVALLEGYIMIAVRLCRRDVISTFGFGAVQSLRLLVHFGLCTIGCLRGALLSISDLCSRLLLRVGDIVIDRFGRLLVVAGA